MPAATRVASPNPRIRLPPYYYAYPYWYGWGYYPPPVYFGLS
jgi:hypothetical protein